MHSNPSGPGVTAPDTPTSVHPYESPEQTDDRSASLRLSLASGPPGYQFRHSGWKDTRTRVLSGLMLSGVSDRRLKRFASCGRHVWILRHRTEPATYKFAFDACHDRFCQICNQARTATIRENLDRCLDDAPIRMLTLTLAHTSDPLHAQLDRLFGGFKQLRRTPIWRSRVRGGIAFLELTYNHETHRWHPHLHVLFLGLFLPQPSIKAHWLAITGDSCIVDIRPIPSKDRAVRYVTKYCTKTVPHSITHDPPLLATAVAALRQRKLLYTFGLCRKWRLLRLEGESDWQLYAHSADLNLATASDPAFTAALLLELDHFLETPLDTKFILEHDPVKVRRRREMAAVPHRNNSDRNNANASRSLFHASGP